MQRQSKFKAVSSVRIGCAGAPARMSREMALSRVDFIEEDVLLREPLPGDKALRKWSAAAGGYTLLAGPDLFVEGDRRDHALAELLRVSAALAAEAVVFRPPPSVAPSQENRDRFASLLADEATTDELGGAARVLCPTGLWDLDVVKAVVRGTDLLIGFDPVANDPLEEIPDALAQTIERGEAYFRLDRLGTTRRRFDNLELETLGAIANELERVWFTFVHAEKIRDGQALRAQLDAG